jgi:hypothetical protein
VFDENSKFVSNDFIKDMKPSITIIGAGISGLSVGLHFEKIIEIVTGLEYIQKMTDLSERRKCSWIIKHYN